LTIERRLIMSKKKKNFIGAFLGSFLGILFCGYFYPVTLPIGCLFGVIIGWWAEDLTKALVNSFYTACRFWKNMASINIHKNFYKSIRHFNETVSRCTKDSLSHILSHVTKFLRWWIKFILRNPKSIHPVSSALLTTINVIIISAAINAFLIFMFYPWPEMIMTEGGLSGKVKQLVPFTPLGIISITLLLTLLPTMFGVIALLARDEKGNSVQNFYTRWERYSRYQPIVYFTRELLFFFWSELKITILFALTIAYWTTLGGALLVFITIPMVTLVTFMINLYKIAQRSDHWWCLGITLVITTISALVFYDNFHNKVILWTVALCTGIVSGVATEGLRQLGLWWFEKKVGERFLYIWYDDDKTLLFSIAVPSWRSLGRNFKIITNKFAL
jgi:hypothetical protein